MDASENAAGEAIAREMALLGAAIVLVQKFEFALYGIVAELSQLPGREGKRYKDLEPEAFLRGNPSDLKVTLGQLAKEFGAPLLLASNELDRLVADRNLIAHNYWRVFHADIQGVAKRDDAEEFLTGFIALVEHLLKVISGLLTRLRIAAAEKEGRAAEITLGEDDLANMLLYHGHVHRVLTFTHEPDGSVTVGPPAESPTADECKP
ncbi:hypothetical protein [Sphingosinicella sp. BN140058]|uniref:hypothetical protein n=1 Tax=Sphingosinicella sp. BN140058 TaxID=1892855 RepID=UPI0010118321|nr:hypothetical protein [Sphingosinicella sp. BN140058]QAY80170.1 hypothetical protein ETR14_26365 [Sphingosinicella sp. BN140058]